MAKKHLSIEESKRRAFYWDQDLSRDMCLGMHMNYVPPYQKHDGIWVRGYCRELTDKERDRYILPPRNREREKEFKKMKYKDLFKRDE